MKTFKPLLLLLLLALVTGCKNKYSLDSNGMPSTLVMGIYAGDNPKQTKQLREPLRLYLQETLGMPVEFNYSSDYTAVIEALRSKKVHMADLSPFSYVIASQKGDLTPIVVLGEGGKPAMYRSVIITSAKTGLNNMDDVKARARQLTLCFSDPASTSGHLVPRGYLDGIGLHPETAFKGVMFAANHSATLLSVKSGKVDLGCTMQILVNMMLDKGMLKPNEIKVLWTSDPMVANPITVRNDLNKDLVKRIRQAYLNINKARPEMLADYLKAYIKNPPRVEYMVANDTMYNGLRKIASSIKNLNVARQ